MVINPSCEQLQLARDVSGGWRNATVEAFTNLGLARPDGHPPPVIRDMEAEIDGDYLIVTVTGYIPDAPDHEFALKPPNTCLTKCRMKGLAVSIVTKVIPSFLSPEELPAASATKKPSPAGFPLWKSASSPHAPRSPLARPPSTGRWFPGASHSHPSCTKWIA